jgi:hypothetical protein
MKEYLMRFRSQAFEGAISLFKRTLLPNFVLSLVMAVISALVIVPLTLQAMGWSLGEFVNMNDNMQEMATKMGSENNPSDVFASMFGTMNITLMLLTMIVGVLMYSWIFFAMMNLNDREIRMKDNSFISALSSSFSGRIFTILGFFILYALIYLAITVIYIFLIFLLMKAASVLGIIVGFIGFFVLILFLLRFILALPAIVHGRMNVTEAIAFSMKHITWKRSGLLFLMGIILMIVFAVFAAILGLIFFSVIRKEGSDVMTLFITNQGISLISSVIIGTFAYASLSTLYFRYSDDEVGETDYQDHLIESN